MSASTFRELLESRATYIALILLGAGLFGYFVYEDYTQDRVKTKYQPTPCEIVSSEVEEHVTRGRRGGRRVSYHLVVSYTYRVEGKRYTSSVFRHGDMGMSRDEAIEAASEYEPGRSRCYVDPDNPENAVLSRNSDTRGLSIAALLGIITALIGVGGWGVLEFVVHRDKGRASAETPREGDPVPMELPAWSSVAKWQAKQRPSGSPQG